MLAPEEVGAFMGPFAFEPLYPIPLIVYRSPKRLSYVLLKAIVLNLAIEVRPIAVRVKVLYRLLFATTSALLSLVPRMAFVSII